MANPNPIHPDDSAGQEAAHERQLAALKLRRTGMAYEDIAIRLGYKCRSSAYYAVKAVLERREREPANEVRAMELGRLDRMLQTLWPRVEFGDLEAMDRALKIMERRAKYEGLDRPSAVALTNPEGTKEYGSGDALTIGERLRALVAFNDRLRARGIAADSASAPDVIDAPKANGTAKGVSGNGSHP